MYFFIALSYLFVIFSLRSICYCLQNLKINILYIYLIFCEMVLYLCFAVYGCCHPCFFLYLKNCVSDLFFTSVMPWSFPSRPTVNQFSLLPRYVLLLWIGLAIRIRNPPNFWPILENSNYSRILLFDWQKNNISLSPLILLRLY